MANVRMKLGRILTRANKLDNQLKNHGRDNPRVNGLIDMVREELNQLIRDAEEGELWTRHRNDTALLPEVSIASATLRSPISQQRHEYNRACPVCFTPRPTRWKGYRCDSCRKFWDRNKEKLMSAICNHGVVEIVRNCMVCRYQRYVAAATRFGIDPWIEGTGCYSQKRVSSVQRGVVVTGRKRRRKAEGKGGEGRKGRKGMTETLRGEEQSVRPDLSPIEHILRSVVSVDEIDAIDILYTHEFVDNQRTVDLLDVTPVDAVDESRVVDSKDVQDFVDHTGLVDLVDAEDNLAITSKDCKDTCTSQIKIKPAPEDSHSPAWKHEDVETFYNNTRPEIKEKPDLEDMSHSVKNYVDVETFKTFNTESNFVIKQDPLAIDDHKEPIGNSRISEAKMNTIKSRGDKSHKSLAHELKMMQKTHRRMAQRMRKLENALNIKP